MGRLVDGRWTSEAALPVDARGAYQRADSTFRHWVTADGAAGPSGDGGFPAAAGRYHLYVAINCPWAHRTLIVRALMGLEDALPVSYVAPRRTGEGWVFDAAHPDGLAGRAALHEVYTAADPRFSGRVTVPVLWDTERATIVNNESAEIIRMLAGPFRPFARHPVELYPEALREEIDALNARIYESVNNGVYRAGFARTQDAYDQAVDGVFATLDDLDGRLADRRYLLGDAPTEADWRLFPTLVRFDVAYYGAFRCNVRRIADYPHLSGYLRDLYQTPGIAPTVDLDTYKRGYYSMSELRNPLGIVPKGPLVDLDAPPGRAHLSRPAAQGGRAA